MTTDELIAYYQGLLIVQYAKADRAKGTIAAFVRQAIASQIVDQVRNGFNFTVGVGLAPGDAAGAQLEVVAGYRGARRLIYGLDLTRKYFSMPRYGQPDADTVPGFAVYGQSPITWFFLNYVDANRPIYSLTDDELCRLTQVRAQSDSNLLSIKEVDDLMFAFFGENVTVKEDGGMKITYIDLISDTDTLFSILNATGSLPQPAGVQLEVIRSETLSHFFGLRRYNQPADPDFVGFGLYGSPQSGSFVRYP